MSILDDGTLVMFGGSNKFDMILQCCQVSYSSIKFIGFNLESIRIIIFYSTLPILLYFVCTVCTIFTNCTGYGT